jgi:OMF family outer membrane factor
MAAQLMLPVLAQEAGSPTAPGTLPRKAAQSTPQTTPASQAASETAPAALSSPDGAGLQRADGLLFPAGLQLPTRAPQRPSGVRQMTLEEVLRLGIEQNPQMQIAAERVEQARATYEQQLTAKRPKLILNNSTAIQPERSIDTGNFFSSRRPEGFPERLVLVSPVTDQFQLSLQMLLTTFGKVENAIAAAFLQIDVQLAAADVDALNLDYSIKEAFFSKLRADATVEVARLNLSVANQSLDDTNALFEQGVMSRYDILQAQIEVTRSVETLAQNLTNVDTASANINNVLAVHEFHVQPISPPAVQVDPRIEPALLEDFALEHRPEIRALDYNRAVAQKLLDSAYGESNPTVTLAANYQTAFGQSLSPVDVPSLTLQIQWQIFDGGYRKARVAEAESVLRSLDATEEQLQNNILLQVEKSWLDLQQTAFNLTTAEQQLANAVEYYDMARRRYLNGLATTLEVSEALRNLVEARAALVEARFNRDLAFAKLEQALGQDVPDRHLSMEFLQNPYPASPIAPDAPKENLP